MDTLPIAWKTQDILAKFASGSSYPMTDLHHKCVLSELVLFSQRDERGTLIAFSMLGIAKDNATRALLLSNYMHESFRLSSGGRLPVVLAWTVCAYLNDMRMGCDVPVRTLPRNPSPTHKNYPLHTTPHPLLSHPPTSPPRLPCSQCVACINKLESFRSYKAMFEVMGYDFGSDTPRDLTSITRRPDATFPDSVDVAFEKVVIKSVKSGTESAGILVSAIAVPPWRRRDATCTLAVLESVRVKALETVTALISSNNSVEKLVQVGITTELAALIELPELRKLAMGCIVSLLYPEPTRSEATRKYYAAQFMADDTRVDETLIELVQAFDSDSAEATLVLSLLVELDAVAADAKLAGEIVDPLLRMTGRDVLADQDHAAKMLAQFAGPGCAPDELIDAGAVEPLVALLGPRTSPDSPAKEHAALALSDLALVNPGVIVEAGAVPALTLMLRSASPGAVKAILHLCVDYKDVIHEAGAERLLAELARSNVQRCGNQFGQDTAPATRLLVKDARLALARLREQRPSRPEPWQQSMLAVQQMVGGVGGANGGRRAPAPAPAPAPAHAPAPALGPARALEHEHPLPLRSGGDDGGGDDGEEGSAFGTDDVLGLYETTPPPSQHASPNMSATTRAALPTSSVGKESPAAPSTTAVPAGSSTGHGPPKRRRTGGPGNGLKKPKRMSSPDAAEACNAAVETSAAGGSTSAASTSAASTSAVSTSAANPCQARKSAVERMFDRAFEYTEIDLTD